MQLLIKFKVAKHQALQGQIAAQMHALRAGRLPLGSAGSPHIVTLGGRSLPIVFSR
jgi:hypothetical protein